MPAIIPHGSTPAGPTSFYSLHRERVVAVKALCSDDAAFLRHLRWNRTAFRAKSNLGLAPCAITKLFWRLVHSSLSERINVRLEMLASVTLPIGVSRLKLPTTSRRTRNLCDAPLISSHVRRSGRKIARQTKVSAASQSMSHPLACSLSLCLDQIIDARNKKRLTIAFLLSTHYTLRNGSTIESPLRQELAAPLQGLQRQLLQAMFITVKESCYVARNKNSVMNFLQIRRVPHTSVLRVGILFLHATRATLTRFPAATQAVSAIPQQTNDLEFP